MSFKYQGKGFVAPTLDETLKPLMLMEAKQTAAEEQYAGLQDAASDLLATIESIRKTNPNSAYVKKYDALYSQIEDMGTQLSEKGINQQFTNTFLNTRKQAVQLIKPLTKAAERYSKYQDLNYSMKLQDPSLVDLSNTNLESFIDPSYTPQGAISMDKINENVLKDTALMKKGIVTTSLKKMQNLGYFKQDITEGLSKETVSQIIQNPAAYPEYDTYLKTTLESQGVPRDLATTNPTAYAQLYKAAAKGLIGLTSETTSKLIEDRNFITPMEKYKMRRDKEEDAIRAASKGTPVYEVNKYGQLTDSSGRPLYVRIDPYTKKETTSTVKQPGFSPKYGVTSMKVPEGEHTQVLRRGNAIYRGAAISPTAFDAARPYFNTNFPTLRTDVKSLDQTQIFVKEGSDKIFFKDAYIDPSNPKELRKEFVEFVPSKKEAAYYEALKKTLKSEEEEVN